MLKWDQHCRSLYAVKTATRCVNSREFRDPHNPYNECLIQGYFHKDWSLGTVTPIPKVNVNNNEPKNWRPSSQIQLPGKILEHVHSQLRLERGGGQRIPPSCACFSINQTFLNINRHIIHQIKAEY